MKKVIVTTTINYPTKALQLFQNMAEWELVIAGDKNTPEMAYKNFDGYLSVENQQNKYPELSRLIGWNCIQRRNLAILEAINQGADIIALVDDDNIPMENWGNNIFIGNPIEVDMYDSPLNDIVMDPVAVTNYPHLWHRGFPIQKLQSRKYDLIPKVVDTFDVQANFWNGDPDIDAICRMEHAPNCLFEKSKFPFHMKRFTPFNSQNTLLTRKAGKEYFLFPNIGRMDDIWAAYKLESEGFKVIYAEPTVFQDRNIHDLTRDFKDEVIGYTQTMELLKALQKDPTYIFEFLPHHSKEMYQEYKKEQCQ